MTYSYPLKLHFRLMALAPRIAMSDAEGKEIFFIEQKVFSLKESVKVFNNSEEKKLVYTINANQIIDFSAKYMFKTADGTPVGSVQRKGMVSLFKATYLVFDKNDQQVFQIAENNPWKAFADSLIRIIPFVELITGFILNPTYAVTLPDQKEPFMTMKKNPSFLESTFEIATTNTSLTKEQELLMLLSFMMMVQLERDRG